MADDHESSSDESLDARNVNFDPLKALYSKKTKVLSAKAPVYDNIVKFESVIAGCAAKKKSGQIEGEPTQRKFLPNQGKVFFQIFYINWKKVEIRNKYNTQSYWLINVHLISNCGNK